ncbi:MAG: BlaI/MecI/CopY family transcriptional regulator [Phycisphaerae bacterium]|nr:BlaI/MecI/CopY family transcriptional regulator [Phycisphaerae bacterium]
MHLSEAEWRLMRVVWRQHPLTARQALDAVVGETHWAYATVKTMLMRLVEKGALSVEPVGNTMVFSPVLQEEAARQSAVDSLLERAFDGAFGSLMHFLMKNQSLSPRKRRELERLLSEWMPAEGPPDRDAK